MKLLPFPALLVAGAVLFPMGVLLSTWLSPASEVWRHLATTVLPELLQNTFILVVGVGVGVNLLGVGLAWLTSLCDFPGRRFFDWALMLPLAIPAYVLAFVMLGLFDFGSPLQSWLADLGITPPDVRHPATVILVMSLAFYPYVYLLARSAFLTQGRHAMDAARMLGRNPWQAFWSVVLPMARPAIAAGTALALMETLADFGAVSIFNYDTFTTAIYKAWLGLFNLQAAAQLATLLLLLVALTLLTEQWLRGRARYHDKDPVAKAWRFSLRGWRAWGASAAAGLVLGLAFLLPMLQLLLWSWQTVRDGLDPRYLALLGRTLTLGGLAALITLACALILTHAQRVGGPLTHLVVRFANLGYALPGSVLAVAIMLTYASIDQWLAQAWLHLSGNEAAPLFSGSIAALLLAYPIRFLAVAYGPVDSAMQRIRPSLPEAARTLGAGNQQLVTRLYLPILRPGLFTALALVFVEVMKEMPATLLLRPFGWDTLAVRIYELTSEGEWQLAALPALCLVLAGLFPVYALLRRSARPTTSSTA